MKIYIKKKKYKCNIIAMISRYLSELKKKFQNITRMRHFHIEIIYILYSLTIIEIYI